MLLYSENRTRQVRRKMDVQSQKARFEHNSAKTTQRDFYAVNYCSCSQSFFLLPATSEGEGGKGMGLPIGLKTHQQHWGTSTLYLMLGKSMMSELTRSTI